MSYYLEQHPNTTTAQYGWPRTRVSGVVGVHTTESGVIPTGADPGAENTAGYIGRRSDHGSYHALADWDSRIKLVRPTFAAWADITNNAHALSVSGAMNAARWRDLSPDRAAGIVRNMGIAAAELVQDAIAHGVLDSPPPARRITAQQAIDGTAAGFYGHGETNPGTRYDPGQNFDWDMFLATYANAIGGGISYQGTTVTEKGFLMALTDKQQDDIYWMLCAPDGRQFLADLVGGRAAERTLNTPIKRYGSGLGGETNLAGFLAWNDSHVDAIVRAVGAVAPAADLEAIKAAVREGMAGSIEVNATVTVKEAKSDG